MVKFAVLALALVGCTPAKPPRAAVIMREGTTVRTSCPEVPPPLEDPGLEDPKVNDVTIDRICVYGGKVDDLLTFKVGDAISAKNMHDSADALVKSKRFDDFELGAEMRGQGAIVYVSVHELPIVEATGERLDPYEVIQTKKKRVAELVDKGYGDATCEATIEPTEPGRVRLTYKVERGPLWKIDQLVFQNASKLSQRELEAASKIGIGDDYDADRMQIAQMYISDAYYRNGMITAKVDDARRDVTDGKVTLTWSVSEGDVYTVGAIKLGKSAPWMQKELLPLVRMKPRMVFNRQTMAEDLSKMRDVVQAKRKKRLEITPVVTLDGAKKTVDVVLDVEEKD